MFDYVCRGRLTGSEKLSGLGVQVPRTDDVESIAPLFWADHCLECSPPACYASCELFEANEIGRCRRVDYMEIGRVPGFDFPVDHLRFRKWSKLRCAYNNSLSFDAQEFLTIYYRHESKVSAAKLADMPSRLFPHRFRYPISRFIHHGFIKKYWADRTRGAGGQEFCFAFYAVNPAKDSRLLLDAFDFDDMPLTRAAFEVKEGFNIWRVPTEKLSRAGEPVFALELFPANNEALEIYVLFSDLVSFKRGSAFAVPVKEKKQPAKKVKCVAWDLDNTLWDGILGEDGLDGVTLRPQIAEVIRMLDERGILNTVCSKNDEAPALAALEKFGLREYFLYPKINWLPKSGNLSEIAKLLNINIDTFAFLDDSAFERAEVESALGCVRVYADSEAESLLSRPEFDVPLTEDSKKRRAFYMAEAKRQDAFTGSTSGDYKAFILSCGFVIDVAPCAEKQELDRCHELLMRTNQLNASTNRIPYEDFCAIAADPKKTVLRVKCADRYGEYGTVGCLILEMCGDRLLCTDFVISCRVAKKKVESAVIMFLMQKYGKPIDVVYRPSERNHVLKDEFVSIGAEYDEQNARMRFAPDTIRDFDWATVKEGGAT